MKSNFSTFVMLGLTVFALSACVSATLPADGDRFDPLEPAMAGGRPYIIGLESELAQSPTWTDLEARTLRYAELTVGSFNGKQNKKIHYRLYQHRTETRGGIVIVSGRTEGLAMYQETILDFVRNGYSVYIHDHRGQGFSERLVTSDPTLGHIDEFDYYVDDLAAFVDGPIQHARDAKRGPLFLLAHSMGGAVAALYLEDVPASQFKGMALVTPMMEPWAAGGENTGLVNRLADVFCDNLSGKVGVVPMVSTRYAQGAPFDRQYQDFRQSNMDRSNGASQSRLRWERNWETRRTATCSGIACGSSNAQVGGASFRWLNQSCSASQQARGKAAARIHLPVLLLQGEKDPKVKPAAQVEFCRNLNDNQGSGYCVGRTIPGAEHALLMESDEFRVPAMNRVLNFFDCAAAGASRCR